jgi:hypothetical protein
MGPPLVVDGWLMIADYIAFHFDWRFHNFYQYRQYRLPLCRRGRGKSPIKAMIFLSDVKVHILKYDFLHIGKHKILSCNDPHKCAPAYFNAALNLSAT